MSRVERAGRTLVLLGFVGTALASGLAAPGPADAALPRWHGGVDLYRTGTFTTQKSWLWCTAADVQIIRNIVYRQTDHSASNQRRYFYWMRRHDRYALPLSEGVDPAGWAAGLRNFVDSRYRLVASRTFSDALRSAVTRLRQTNLPVAITVQNGKHGWVLTGFRATADPLVTTRFQVTSVNVVGPLWGLQSRTYGYDMRPDTRLTPSQLRGFLTPWRYAPIHMAWEGRYVTIQPIPRSVAPATTTARTRAASPPPTARPAATTAPTPTSTPMPAASPSPTSAPSPTPGRTPAPAAALVSTSDPAAAVAEQVGPAPSPKTDSTPLVGALVIGLLLLMAVPVLLLRTRS